MTPDPQSEITRLESERQRLSGELDRAYAQMSEITSRLLALSETSDALAMIHDTTGVASTVLDVAARTAGTHIGALFLSHGEGSFALVASLGFPEEEQLSLGESLPDLALCNLAENEVRSIDAAEALESESFREWQEETLAADPASPTMPTLGLYLPVALEDRVLAVLALGPPDRGGTYDEETRIFLEHVTSQGALALDRAILFQSNEDRLQSLDALLRVSRELTSTLDLDHVLLTSVNLTSAIVDRERAVLALFEGGRLRIKAVNDFPRVDTGTAERLGLEKVLEWLSYRRTEEPLIVRLSEVEANEGHEGRDIWLSYFQGDMRGACVFGLKDDQGPVGVLLLESFREDAFDRQDDREALGVLVGQLSVAIRNAELYKKLPMIGALAPLAARQRQWRRMDPKRRQRLLIQFVIALLLVGVVPWPAAIGGDGQVLPGAEFPVRTWTGGIVSSVDVQSGDRVVAGQRLASLAPEALGPRLAALRAEAERARLGSARASGERDAFGRRMADLDREQAMARLASAETEQSRAQLLAPSSGYVLTPALQERVGASLAPGEVFCQVSPLDTLRVEVAVSEVDIDRIHAGQPIRLKVLGFPDRQFKGRVSEVSWQGDSPKPGLPSVFTVLGWVANPGPSLRSGMTGRARIDVGRDTLLVRWMRGVWRWLRMNFWA